MKAPDIPGGLHGQPSNRSIMLVLAYLPPFAVIPLLVEKEDADLQSCSA